MKLTNRIALLTVWLITVIAVFAQDNSKGYEQSSDKRTPVQENYGAFSSNQSDFSERPSGEKRSTIILITGVRFAYPLVQKWIDDYAVINPNVQIIIESRGSNDPARYDLLIEAYEPDEETRNSRKYAYVARYAILPVSNSQSAFTKIYSEKGINRELISQLYFHDLFSDKKEPIRVPYTVYTRLQKAGSPITFSNYFGYQQKDISGKSIAGADEHLLKAVLRDSTALSYLPLNFLYDFSTGKPIPGITIIPVDLNGNGKVSEDEKIYNDLSTVIKRLEESDPDEIQNIPTAHLHLSVDQSNTNPEVSAFLQWISKNGGKDLHAYGFLKPDPSRLEGNQRAGILKNQD